MKSALVIGGDSRIGRAVAARLAAEGYHVAATTRRRDLVGADRPFLDLAAADDGPVALPPCDVCLVAAAMASLEACHRQPELTSRINVEGTRAVVRRVAANGGFVLLLSTNHVFDGTLPRRSPAAPIAPLNPYGAQKALSETAVLAQGRLGAVLRLSKVLSSDAALLQRWAEALRRSRPVEAFGDMRLAPVTLETVVDVAVRILERKAAGLHHLSGDEDISYADIARRLATRLGVPLSLVTERSFRDAGLTADSAPTHTTLDNSGLVLLGMAAPATLPCVESVLAEVVKNTAAEDRPD